MGEYTEEGGRKKKLTGQQGKLGSRKLQRHHNCSALSREEVSEESEESDEK